MDEFESIALVQPMNKKMHKQMFILSIKIPTKQSNLWTSKRLGLVFIKRENQSSLRTSKANNYHFTKTNHT